MESYISKKHTQRIFGKGFSDSVKQDKHLGALGFGKTGPNRRARTAVVITFLCITCILLLGKLFYVTILKGEYYQDLAKGNKTRIEPIRPARGVLFDRNGVVLAENKPLYKSCDTTGLYCTELSETEGRKRQLEKKNVVLDYQRFYPTASTSAHVIGYVQELNQEQLDEKNNDIRKSLLLSEMQYCQQCFSMGEKTGVSAAEWAFNDQLRGFLGKRLLEVDAFGISVRELARVDKIDGKNITLSIDFQLQKKVQDAVQDALEKTGSEAGGAIAINPKTGEILALYSSPSYDTNVFVDSTASARFRTDLLNDPKKPLFNRMISGVYPPGSTFKIITASSGLEEGVIDKDTKVNDTGIVTVGAFNFRNWYFTQYGRTEGDVDIVKALRRSNDTFFYKLGEWVGIEKLETWAKNFGLSEKTGIELPGEVEGLIRRDRRWYLGDTYHLAIGQGDLQTTPLQVAQWTQVIANNGIKCKPTILKKEKGDCSDIGLSYNTIELVKEGLKQACSTGGTAYPLFNFTVNTASSSASTRTFSQSDTFISLGNGGVQIPVSCKTGTSQISATEERTHAWLTAYAPSNDPKIVVTVLLEKGGEGSRDAAPVVKEILKEWFSRERN